MREAVGSTFLFNIMIVFIFFFASFLAIAINYSQAFRIKNQIINYIEQYEGIDDIDDRERIVEYINSSGYYRDNVNCDCNDIVCTDYEINRHRDNNPNGSRVSVGSNRTNGLCVRKLSNANGDTYYRVTTFVSFNLPVIGQFFTFPVKGETRIITND